MGDHTAIAADSQLIVSLVVGTRPHEPTSALVQETQQRLRPGPLPALVTDAYDGYESAIRAALGRRSECLTPACQGGRVVLSSAGPRAWRMGRGKNSRKGVGWSG